MISQFKKHSYDNKDVCYFRSHLVSHFLKYWAKRDKIKQKRQHEIFLSENVVTPVEYPWNATAIKPEKWQLGLCDEMHKPHSQTISRAKKRRVKPRSARARSCWGRGRDLLISGNSRPVQEVLRADSCWEYWGGGRYSLAALVGRFWWLNTAQNLWECGSVPL